MKTLLVFFTVVSLAIYTAALCPSGCTCYDDSPCEYYCQGTQCQPQIPSGGTCSGHYVHPQECGSGYYCDSDYTCQSQKSDGSTCLYDYSCWSNNCDSGICGGAYIPFRWTYYILIPVIVVSCILVFVGVIIRRRRRLIVTSYPTQCQSQSQNQSVVVGLPASTPYGYQHPAMAGGMQPPPYSGPNYTPYRV